MSYQLAVMGNPIAHSLSPMIHERFAAASGIDLTYDKMLVTEDQFQTKTRAFFDQNGKGLNVTVPHKYAAFTFADELSSDAQFAQAVNTLIRLEDGTIRGENTDGVGLLNDIKTNLGWTLKGRRILVLGAGGAVQGVIQNLLSESPKTIVVANRTVSKAQDLVKRHDNSLLLASSIVELGQMDAFDVIISASSAGLALSHAKPETLGFTDNLRHEETCCYDMIYGKSTPLLTWANQSQTGEVSDGLGMLVEQAAKSFELWFGLRVNTQPVLQELRSTLQKI